MDTDQLKISLQSFPKWEPKTSVWWMVCPTDDVTGGQGVPWTVYPMDSMLRSWFLTTSPSQ